MASKMVGSKVILCTDGCANEGLGSIETGDYSAASDFYLRLGETASAKGFVIFICLLQISHCMTTSFYRGNFAVTRCESVSPHVSTDPRAIVLTDDDPPTDLSFGKFQIAILSQQPVI